MDTLSRMAFATCALGFAGCSSSSDAPSSAPDAHGTWTLSDAGVLHVRESLPAERTYPDPPTRPAQAPERPRLESPAPMPTPEEAWSRLLERWNALGISTDGLPAMTFESNFADSGAPLYARYVSESDGSQTRYLAQGIAVATYDESWLQRLAQGETPRGTDPGCVAIIHYVRSEALGPQWINYRTRDESTAGVVNEIFWAESSHVDGEKLGWHREGGPRYRGFCRSSGFEGQLEFWAPEGFLQEQQTYRADVVDGPCSVWNAEGRLVQRGQLTATGRQGESDEWDDEREGRYERLFYEADELHGWQAFYDPAGWKALESWYEHGEATGPFRRFHESGGVQFEVMRVAGEFEGAAKSFDEEGTLTELEHYIRGRLNGPYRKFDADGDVVIEGHHLEGQLHGTWSRRDEEAGGGRGELEYRAGKRHGVARRFDARGRLDFEGRFEDDVAVSPWRMILFDHDLPAPEGSISGTGSVDGEGQPNGAWTFRHANGAVAAEGAFDEDGDRFGTWRFYWPSGAKFAEGECLVDREGEWTFWRESGTVLRRGSYFLAQRAGAWIELDERGWVETEIIYGSGPSEFSGHQRSYLRVELEEAPRDGEARDPLQKNGVFDYTDDEGKVIGRQRYFNGREVD